MKIKGFAIENCRRIPQMTTSLRTGSRSAFKVSIGLLARLC